SVNLYNPLRQLASLWSSFQLAMASWDRVSLILSLTSNLPMVENKFHEPGSAVVEFRDVYFSYPNGKEILRRINLKLKRGKTYALVGPTGGGKTTTASLMARLYDPTKGSILLGGKDLRAYSEHERAKKIGFILQEPFLFTGTLQDNILYGNERYALFNPEQLTESIKAAGLEDLLAIFERGLATEVLSDGNSMSL